ncbi:hypothetical protein KA017_01500 [Candidatus Woesebacteria bacterium]|nr:hypothetical protein [Candidatus Woesebacteria bacterium]
MTITKILYHPIIILALTIGAIMFFFSLDKSGKKTQNSSENIRVLEHEVGQISKEIIELEEKIEVVESGQFKEKVVRNELLLQKPGEYVLQIAETESSALDSDCVNNECENRNEKIDKSPLLAWEKILF